MSGLKTIREFAMETPTDHVEKQHQRFIRIFVSEINPWTPKSPQETVLAAPRSKQEALQEMRMMWFGLITANVLYVYIGETEPVLSWLSFRHAAKTFAILAMLSFIAFAWALWKRYLPAVEALRDQPENMQAVKRWMGRWTILLCNASSLTLFGLAFRMGGKTLQQSAPFYLVGVLLTLWLWPRQVWSSARIAS
jgi:hypothetical protein